MAKAYDCVEWVFLERVLLKMGFAEKWIGWIMNCVRTVSYRVMVNGKKTDIFKPSRGIRQGDPLSPFLFLLVADLLSMSMSKAVQEGTIRGIKMKKDYPIVSHLFFADDALFFIEASTSNGRKLKTILEAYCQASGQQVNFEKSSVVFSPNTKEGTRKELCEIFGIKYDAKPGKYLGLPVEWGKE